MADYDNRGPVSPGAPGEGGWNPAPRPFSGKQMTPPEPRLPGQQERVGGCADDPDLRGARILTSRSS